MQYCSKHGAAAAAAPRKSCRRPSRHKTLGGRRITGYTHSRGTLMDNNNTFAGFLCWVNLEHYKTRTLYLSRYTFLRLVIFIGW